MRALIVAALTLAAGAVEPAVGRIQGHVHYPACFPPGDLQVCAVRSDGLSRCTTELTDTERGIAYALEVPAGRYLVYARTETYFPGYRAYYSKAVLCGLRLECQDHEPIEVEVRPRQTVRGIDPDDWYAPVEAPPLPPSV